MIHKFVQDEIDSKLEEAWVKMKLHKEINAIFWPKQFKSIKYSPEKEKAKIKALNSLKVHTELSEPKQNKVRIRSRIKTENEISSEVFISRNILKEEKKDEI